jgi:predicted DsbA family dithiol-disulfide isomerase
MTLELQVFIDHTCPYSFMAFTAARQAARGRPLHLRWQPLPIAGAEAGLTAAERAMLVTRREADWPAVQAQAAARFGLRLERPPWGSDARGPAAAALWVADQAPPRAEAFHSRLYRAFFQEGRDIGDPDVLEALVAELGLDGTALRAALASDRLDSRLGEALATAEGRGVTVVPAMLIGDYLLLGAQPAEVLTRTLDQIDAADGPIAAGATGGMPCGS